MNCEIIRNCIPSIIALTLTGLYSIIDGLFIGNVIGENGLAAINIAWPIPAFITALGTGIGTGGCIFYSIHIGKKKTQTAGQSLSLTFLCFVLAAIGTFFLLYPVSKSILTWLGARDIVLAFQIIIRFCFLNVSKIIGYNSVRTYIIATK